MRPRPADDPTHTETPLPLSSTRERRALRYHALIAAAVGLLSGLICWLALDRGTGTGGDFTWAWRAAGDLLAGRDVYDRPFGDDLVPYPLPAALIAMPLAALPAPLAAGVFFGTSSGLLAWCLLGTGAPWRLLMLLSWPYAYGLLYAQWPPLILCMAFLGPLLPLLLVKPQTAIPMLVLRPPTWPGIVLLGAVAAISLLIDPDWPLAWLRQIGGYQGSAPPLLSLPLGPLLLLALLRYRDRHAWLLLVSALMPQRVVYDQLALLLVARTPRQLLLLTVCSWATLPAILIFDGWFNLPGGWPAWIILTLYLPALAVILQGSAGRSGRTGEPGHSAL